MDQVSLRSLLDNLIATWENEVVEFKRASIDYDTNKIGEYFSALANEANLHNVECAWLVFGVHNTTLSVVGSNYCKDHDHLQRLKMNIKEGTQPKITFRNIYELLDPKGRVVLFEIPAAPIGIPISWKGHYYSRAG